MCRRRVSEIFLCVSLVCVNFILSDRKKVFTPLPGIEQVANALRRPIIRYSSLGGVSRSAVLSPHKQHVRSSVRTQTTHM